MSTIRAPRAMVLHAEVMREFGEAEDTDWSPADHALYLAPWRDQLVDGSLGPWHGPTTESRYNEQVRRFEDECRGGIGSPSLWDQQEFERLHSTRSSTKKATRAALRADHDVIARMVRRQGDELPRRELEVYYAYWRDALSVKQAATRLGVQEQTVEGWIKALRKRAKGG
jgi:hypothetical protein